MSTQPTPETFLIHSEEIVHVDHAFATLLGVSSPDELIGTAVADLAIPKFRSALQEQIRQIQTGDASVLALSLELETAQDTPVRVIAVSSLVQWEGSQQIQTTVFPSERGAPTITHLFEETMQEAPIGITISDPSQPDNPLIYVNDKFCELTGYSRQEILGQNCRFLQGEATRDAPVRKMREAIDEELPVTVDVRNYRADGSMFWNRVTIIPLRFDSETVTHYLGYQQDISAEKRYEQDLTLFKEHAKGTPKSIMITSPEETIEYVNPAFEELTGYTAAEAIGQSPSILLSDEDNDKKLYQEIRAQITAGDTWEGKQAALTKYGERFEVTQRIIPVTDEEDELTHFVWIQQDITENVLTTQAMGVLKRVLRHNLRNALTVIEGNAGLLESDDIDAGQRKTLLAGIRREASSMKSVAEKINALRTVWDPAEAHQTWESIDINGLVERYRNQYPEADITATITGDSTISVRNAAVFGFALDEAVENAIRHTEKSPPTVVITVDQDRADDRLRVSIADTGPGIPAIDRMPIETGEETMLSHSLGIGLWAMDWVARTLGGELEISDNDPQGSVVTFLLPNPPDEEIELDT